MVFYMQFSVAILFNYIAATIKCASWIVPSSINFYIPVIAVCSLSSLTRTVAHVYNTALVITKNFLCITQYSRTQLYFI